jgi:hypothetical protein
VIDELFDFADLHDVRALLWSWLKTTVTGTYHKDLSATERSAIITLYEKLEKLVEAAHVMHESREDHAKRKSEEISDVKPLSCTILFLREKNGLPAKILGIFNILKSTYGPAHHQPLRRVHACKPLTREVF